MTDWVGDIIELHTKFGDIHQIVRKLSPEVKAEFYRFRSRFLTEELDEFRRADTPDKAVDALIDLCVVAIGTLHIFGIDADKAWNKVYQANMRKEVGKNPGRKNHFGLPDLIKPEGWVAPSHEDNVGVLDSVFVELFKPELEV
jgi:predicted HAD superfamily Cof-like phosphohydrolase